MGTNAIAEQLRAEALTKARAAELIDGLQVALDAANAELDATRRDLSASHQANVQLVKEGDELEAEVGRLRSGVDELARERDEAGRLLTAAEMERDLYRRAQERFEREARILSGKVERLKRARTDSDFVVYDSLIYRGGGKPDTRALGMEPIVCEGHRWFKDPNAHAPAEADEAATRAFLRTIPAGVPLVVNIEHWPVDVRGDGVSADVVRESVAKMIKLLGWVRSERPDLSVGYWGQAPVHGYYDATNLETVVENPVPYAQSGQGKGHWANYRAWQRANDLVRPLAEAVDVLYPSLYATGVQYDAYSEWAAHVRAECTRLAPGKPAVAFVWPAEMLDSTPATAPRHDRLPANFFRLCLEHARLLFDGVALWDFGPAKEFGTGDRMDVSAPWWRDAAVPWLGELKTSRAAEAAALAN